MGFCVGCFALVRESRGNWTICSGYRLPLSLYWYGFFVEESISLTSLPFLILLVRFAPMWSDICGL